MLLCSFTAVCVPEVPSQRAVKVHHLPSTFAVHGLHTAGVEGMCTALLRCSSICLMRVEREAGVCTAVQTDVGVVVRPKRYRAVLMDQDMLHR